VAIARIMDALDCRVALSATAPEATLSSCGLRRHRWSLSDDPSSHPKKTLQVRGGFGIGTAFLSAVQGKAEKD